MLWLTGGVTRRLYVKVSSIAEHSRKSQYEQLRFIQSDQRSLLQDWACFSTTTQLRHPDFPFGTHHPKCGLADALVRVAYGQTPVSPLPQVFGSRLTSVREVKMTGS